MKEPKFSERLSDVENSFKKIKIKIIVAIETRLGRDLTPQEKQDIEKEIGL